MNNPRDAWSAWCPAHFDTAAACDRFVLAVTSRGAGEFEVRPIPDEARGAWVRWRSGRFATINDMAYSHAGRIAVSGKRDLW